MIKKLIVLTVAGILSLGLTQKVQGAEIQTIKTPAIIKEETLNNIRQGKLKKSNQELFIHGNYAISASGQMNTIEQMEQVSFGWAQLQYDTASKKVIFLTEKQVGNDFAIPEGFEIPFDKAKNSGAATYGLVFMNDRQVAQDAEGNPVTLAEMIFTNPNVEQEVINQIVNYANKIEKNGISRSFDGVTIDFENFYNPKLKTYYNSFLEKLDKALGANGKQLIVAVPPNTYFKGYDYKKIGELADYVILMAHDYAPTKMTEADRKLGWTLTPITPIDQIYDALQAITDPVTGVADKNKILFQLSFGSVQWQQQNQMILNEWAYTPSYDKIANRLKEDKTELYYDINYQNPYAVYWDNNVRNVIWYENEASIDAKIALANWFGINKISLWRIGTIPQFEDSLSKVIDLNIVDQFLLIPNVE